MASFDTQSWFRPQTAPEAARAWLRYRRLLESERLPAAVLDLDALRRNCDLLVSKLAAGVTLRVASKSVRCPWVLRFLLDRHPGRLRGLMTFSPRETELLAQQGFVDLLCAYPVARMDSARIFAQLVAAGVDAVPMVDCERHLELLSRAAQEQGCTVVCCLDVDVSWRPLSALARGPFRGADAHLGVRRSPVRTCDQALRLARYARSLGGVRIGAVMAYEAQVAGMPDRVPGEEALRPVKQVIKSRSRVLAQRRRTEVVEALRSAGFAIEVVNGGGTGSVASSSQDGSCTEVTAGSGFYAPHSFDGFDDLALVPALVFALEVVRRSDPDFVTLAGGGYVASGPAGVSRLPQVHLPHGLTPLGMEGWGEVQTPLAVGPDAPSLRLGDPVICRHTKAGELLERFSEVLVMEGEEVTVRAPTLRGLGGCFF